MKKYLTRADVREIDRRAEADGLPTRVLMENAGRGAADIIMGLGFTGPGLICCGRGNNGGDGFVAARHLASRGVDVRVLLLAESAGTSGPAFENWSALRATPIPHLRLRPIDERELIAELDQAGWIVDALFGIGLEAPVRAPFDRVIACLNAATAPIVAIDVPSGLDADTGEPLGTAVRAKHTITFVAPKTGFANPASTALTGRVHVVNLGLGFIP